MRRKLLLGVGVTFGLVLPLGCTNSTPLTPTASSTTPRPDGSTLKVLAPALVSPVSGGRVNTRQPTLVLQRASGEFATPQVSYEIQVTTPGGELAYTSTVAGGAANGSGTVSHVVSALLGQNTSYRWRARAVVGSDAGPWSGAASGAVMLVTNALGPASSNDEFKDFFFALIVQKGVGPIASAAGLASMEPDLVAVGIILQKSSSGEVRGRIYLPSGNPNNLFARSVDVAGFGGPWLWLPRGSTTCEGICPS